MFPMSGLGVQTLIVGLLGIAMWLTRPTWVPLIDPGRPSQYAQREHVLEASLNMDLDEGGLLETVQSPFQKIQVYSTVGFGRVLVIDDDLMLTNRDEKSYHEMLVHVPLNYMPAARRVLVVGGGDGGTAKQVLRHPNIEQVRVVDIDEQVVHVSRRHFPELASSFDDPRTALDHVDASKFLDDTVLDFDVLLVDSTDFNQADTLFTPRFYRAAKRVLARQRGILTINLTSLSWNLQGASQAVRKLRKIFRYVHVYQVAQPTYLSGQYGYALCSDFVSPTEASVDWAAFRAKRIETWYYSAQVHAAAFVLPAYIQRALQDHDPIYPVTVGALHVDTPSV